MLEFLVPVVPPFNLRENFNAHCHKGWLAVLLAPVPFRLAKRRHVNTDHKFANAGKISTWHV